MIQLYSPPKKLKSVINIACFFIILGFTGLFPAKSFGQAPTLSYASPQVYNTGVSIGTLRPSPRTGFSGPTYDPTHNFIASGLLPNAFGLGRDAAGNLYCSDETHGLVYKVSGNAGPVVFATITDAFGIAVDRSGNVYTSTPNEGLVYKTTSSGTTTVFASGLNSPTGIAVDTKGNVYVAEYSANQLTELPATGGTPIKLGTFNSINVVAVDGAGYIYTNNNFSLVKVPPGGGTSVTLADVNQSTSPQAITVDNNGNLFVNVGRTTVSELVNDGNNTILGVSSGFGGVYGLTTDGLGHVFSLDLNSASIVQLNPAGGLFITPALPAGLHFDGTTFGDITGIPTTASPATNYTVTAYNSSGSGQATVNLTVNQNKALLSNLQLSAGTLSPAFARTKQSYSAAVPLATSSITVTPTLVTAGSTITVNNLAVTSGSASGPIALSPGQNTITVTVTSANGAQALSYIVTVTRINQTIATLSNLAVSHGTLSPAFSSQTNSYTVSVPSSTNQFKITPTTTDPNATVTVAGQPVASGTLSQAIAIPVGSTDITVQVTAQDGTTIQSYVITVQRLIANDVNLANIILSSGVVTPQTFHGYDGAYNADVGDGVTSITITPTTEDPTTLVTIGDQTLNSGQTSSQIALAPGVTIIYLWVHTANGIGSENYTIYVNRDKGPSTTLTKFKLSRGLLSPVFSPNVTSYTATVVNGVSSFTISATTNDPAAALSVNGVSTASGTTSPSIPLPVGTTNINTTVTGSDGVNSTTYSLAITRPPSSNANLSSFRLSSGALSPAFSGVTTSYTAIVANGVSSINVTPTTADTTATATLNGTSIVSGTATLFPLNVGDNTITIVVTAQDGVTQNTYTVVVTRKPSTNDNLVALRLGAGIPLSPSFAFATTNYTANVANGVSSTTVTPTAFDATASITVNGFAVASASASGAISLSVGTNVISTIVTAQDGVTSQTYTITVTRAPSTNANLSLIKLKNGILSPAYSPATTGYSASVVNGVQSDALTPTAADPAASIVVDGNPVASGSESPVELLSVGNTTFTIIVTAQDGVTTKIYSVMVNRAGSGPINVPDESLSVAQPVETPVMDDNIIVVHQGVTPNGDGINDYLVIDGIQAYPDNKLAVMNRNGAVVFEARGYDNSNHVFDGHSNKNGALQLPGTYFYSLEYTVKGVTKRKTGYLILKY